MWQRGRGDGCVVGASHGKRGEMAGVSAKRGRVRYSLSFPFPFPPPFPFPFPFLSCPLPFLLSLFLSSSLFLCDFYCFLSVFFSFPFLSALPLLLAPAPLLPALASQLGRGAGPRIHETTTSDHEYSHGAATRASNRIRAQGREIGSRNRLPSHRATTRARTATRFTQRARKSGVSTATKV